MTRKKHSGCMYARTEKNHGPYAPDALYSLMNPSQPSFSGQPGPLARPTMVHRAQYFQESWIVSDMIQAKRLMCVYVRTGYTALVIVQPQTLLSLLSDAVVEMTGTKAKLTSFISDKKKRKGCNTCVYKAYLFALFVCLSLCLFFKLIVQSQSQNDLSSCKEIAPWDMIPKH